MQLIEMAKETPPEGLRCSRCGRILKNPKSILAGMGNVCKRKHDQENQERTGNNEEVEIPKSASARNNI